MAVRTDDDQHKPEDQTKPTDDDQRKPDDDGGEGHDDEGRDDEGRNDDSSQGDLIRELEALRPLKKEVGNYRRRMKDAEKAAEDAQKERDEALAAVDKMKEAVMESKLLAAAQGRLADPQDVLRLGDLDGLTWDSDPAQFAEVVDALVKTKPYLAHGTTPDADLGPRGDDTKTGADANDWFRKALQQG